MGHNLHLKCIICDLNSEDIIGESILCFLHMVVFKVHLWFFMVFLAPHLLLMLFVCMVLLMHKRNVIGNR